MHTSKHTIKGYSVANKQKGEKSKLKPQQRQGLQFKNNA